MAERKAISTPSLVNALTSLLCELRHVSCRVRYEEAAAASREADVKLQTCHANKDTVVAERQARSIRSAHLHDGLVLTALTLQGTLRGSSCSQQGGGRQAADVPRQQEDCGGRAQG